MILAALFLFLAAATNLPAPLHPPEDPTTVLVQILTETRELGRRPGEDFIKHEFFIGGADDDDTNKDTGVVILIQTLDGRERMTIQVTKMERDRSDPRIKTARETKSIVGALEGRIFRILRSDYDKDELESICNEILRAVRDKKRLIKGSGLERPQDLNENYRAVAKSTSSCLRNILCLKIEVGR